MRYEVQERTEDINRSAKDPAEGSAPLLSVVIPALNEEDGIADIVQRVMGVEKALLDVGLRGLEVIVVDDGSEDRTADIVAGMKGPQLVKHTVNAGYGAAIKTGFKYAKGDLLAFLDADGTYPPEKLPELCKAIISQDAEVAVGSRRSGAESRMPLVRRLGNFIWSSLVTLIGHQRCADPASGMRVLRRSMLSRLYPLPDGLNFTPVMSTRCIHEGLNVIELPIPYKERLGRSKLSVVRDGTRFLKTILWTSLEYNPVKLMGMAGLAPVAVSVLIGASVVAARLQGITSLGYWGTIGVFLALVLSVAGISIYSLGVTFNFLVALFHRTPVRQGILGGRFVKKSVEHYFGALGSISLFSGASLALTAAILGYRGWEIERLWLWLLASALFLLVGLQMIIWWIVARVLEVLAGREQLIGLDMARQADTTVD